jgi:hypothetical protein
LALRSGSELSSADKNGYTGVVERQWEGRKATEPAKPPEAFFFALERAALLFANFLCWLAFVQLQSDIFCCWPQFALEPGLFGELGELLCCSRDFRSLRWGLRVFSLWLRPPSAGLLDPARLHQRKPPLCVHSPLLVCGRLRAMQAHGQAPLFRPTTAFFLPVIATRSIVLSTGAGSSGC